MDVPSYLRYVSCGPFTETLSHSSPHLCYLLLITTCAAPALHRLQVKREIDEEDGRCRSYLPDVTRIVVINTSRAVFLNTHHSVIIRKYVCVGGEVSLLSLPPAIAFRKAWCDCAVPPERY